MKFKYRRTAWIQTDMETIRNVLTSQCFEKDFLPEIARYPSTDVENSPSETGSAVSWLRGQGMDIGLVRKDLDVTIDSITFRYQQRSAGVLVTLHVVYEKPFGKYFLKAHRALWFLFSVKLRVLKQDLEGGELQGVATNKLATV